eukprot:5300050-Prymnesium_polylepis.1
MTAGPPVRLISAPASAAPRSTSKLRSGFLSRSAAPASSMDLEKSASASANKNSYAETSALQSSSARRHSCTSVCAMTVQHASRSRIVSSPKTIPSWSAIGLRPSASAESWPFCTKQAPPAALLACCSVAPAW